MHSTLLLLLLLLILCFCPLKKLFLKSQLGQLLSYFTSQKTKKFAAADDDNKPPYFK
jgi:hypothetical protein